MTAKTNLLRLVGVGSVCVLLLCCSAFATSGVPMQDACEEVYTICSDEDYYSETTYYKSEEEFDKTCRAAGGDVSVSLTETEDSGKQFISGIVKKMWVSETADETGGIADSHLMTKTEVTALEAAKETGEQPTALLYIGEDNTDYYYLHIYLSVIYDPVQKCYEVKGTAGWDAILVWAWDNWKAAEEYHDDFMGITWGGKRQIIATSRSFTAQYHDNTIVQASRNLSQFDVGYVWQFREKSGWMGKELKSAIAKVSLTNRNGNTVPLTNTKLIYIHTYGSLDFALEFTYQDEEFAASVGVSSGEKSWRVELDVFGLKF